MARFAYFVMVHHKPRQFAWLLNAIDDPRDRIWVHVDLKSRLGLKADRRGLWAAVRRTCAGRPNVSLLPSRVTNWGGWSLSRALLDAIARALAADADWTYFINLSGQCYPIRPIDSIRDALDAAGDRVHVELRPLASLPADDWHRRWNPMLETPLRALRLPGRKPPPRGFRIEHKGSQWVVLPRAFCRWLVDAPLTRAVSRYLSGLLLSDELLIQTLATNGPWAERIGDHGRAIVWPGPKLLTGDDLPMLRASPAWFARKFDVDRAPDVVQALAAENGFIAGP